MSSVVILGSSSFLGRVLLNNINSNISFKAIVRKIPVDADKYNERVKWIKLDNINFSSLINIFEKGDVVINLTYIKNNNRNDNISLINHIVDASIYSKISRLIHCSTASVVGDNDTNNINELTPCNPKTNYEKVKMEVEKIVLSSLTKGIDIGILRPTAIVGYGSKNLNYLQHLQNLTHYQERLAKIHNFEIVPINKIKEKDLYLKCLSLQIVNLHLLISLEKVLHTNYNILVFYQH